MDRYLEDEHKPSQLKAFKIPKVEVVKETAHQSLVNAILDAVGETRYPYVTWVKWVHESKASANQILDWCKKANRLPPQYSKDGYMRNRLLGK